MQDGLFVVTFSAGTATGKGVLVLRDGVLRGGDSGFYYTGRLQARDGRLEGALELVNFDPAERSIFGQLPSLRLDLAGDDFRERGILAGQVVGNPDLSFTLELYRVAD